MRAGNATQLRHTVEPAIAAVERKEKATAATVGVLKTKVALDGEDMRDSLRALGREVNKTIDEMEDRVDEVSPLTVI